MLRSVWLRSPRELRVAPGTVVYYVANDPVHAEADIPLMEYLSDVKVNFGPVQSFKGLDEEGVKVLEVVP